MRSNNLNREKITTCVVGLMKQCRKNCESNDVGIEHSRDKAIETWQCTNTAPLKGKCQGIRDTMASKEMEMEEARIFITPIYDMEKFPGVSAI